MTKTFETAPLSAPVAVELPEAVEFLGESQWKVLMALMDAVIPAVRIQDSTKATQDHDISAIHLPSAQYSEVATKLRNAAPPLRSSDVLEAYLAERPSDNPVFTQVLKCVLTNVPPDKQRAMRVLLSILSTRPGSFLLTSYATPLPSLSISDRIRILQNWSNASLWTFRALFKSITALAKLAHIRSSTTFAPLTGFPSIPASWVAGSTSYPFEFLQFHPSTTNPQFSVEVTTDVVIVGSGCGAGVVANRLASEFGPSLNILVLEKGLHFDARHFPLSQTAGLSTLFEAGGAIESDDNSMTVTAGSCFGGGGTVNWSASLRTQDFVRREWAQEGGLPFFESDEFQGCLDRVCEIMGVNGEVVRPNHANRVLLEGSKQLGYQASIVPQNCRGERHDCGYCTLGCWKGEKMGPVNGWFPEAAKQGAKFVEGMKVERVILEEKEGKKVAKGVRGVWTARDGAKVEVVVRAKKVVVSCGTLWSPIVLLNSGIKNPHIGKNLHLHPVNFVSGVFDYDVQPWEGGILTSVVTSFENLDSKGHGVKLEAMPMMPTMCLPYVQWTSGIDFKLLAAKYRHTNSFISICRDRDSGHIYSDPVTGRPRIAYTPSDFDRAHILHGVVELCKILYARNAREIHPSIAGFPPFIRHGDYKTADQEKMDFDKWLNKLQTHGNKPPVTPFASAHQMGTCRMSAEPKNGVVDPKGHVWGTEGLYIADASVFPSASGVNPMVTTMAIADWIGKGLCEDLRREGVNAKL
ncbi:long-chain fatty alcohol dehydrogenase [Parathielavia appendiculata]|uniref:Long-chain-alcohol oxidase n=1 Tax=Parathielavia appendiculata TaxID=2587402 RepID=A0AAN6Z216_9PEZI|nr:long-chain fatty alcohol dehydrogenase [Parathielavia appendiculata]